MCLKNHQTGWYTMTDFYKEFTGFRDAEPDEIKSKLRAPNGLKLTEALFVETIQAPSRANYSPLYSLREYENAGLPSAYLIYLHAIDETDAALKLVGSLSHWRRLCDLNWFIHGRREIGFEGLAQWRQDKAVRDRTYARQQLIKQAKDGNVTAARALEKMATDEFNAAEKLKSSKPGKKGSSGSSEEIEGLEFLDEYKNKEK